MVNSTLKVPDLTEEDSDPEFQNGAFILEGKPKRGKKLTKNTKIDTEKKRKRRSEVLGEINSKRSRMLDAPQSAHLVIL